MVDDRSRVIIVGCGNDLSRHLTLEGLREIRRCDVVYYSRDVIGAPELLDREGVTGIDLTDLAVFGEPRSESHQRIAHAVMIGAKRANSVAWLTQGNPAVLCGVSYELVALCKESNLKLQICAGISCVDTLLIDVGLDVLKDGLKVIEASRLLIGSHTPDPDSTCIILQLARADTWLNILDAAPTENCLERVVKTLNKYYSDSRNCCIVTSPRNEGVDAKLTWTSLRALAGCVDAVDPWASLVIPGLGRTHESITSACEWLLDYAHMERMYKTPLRRVLEQL